MLIYFIDLVGEGVSMADSGVYSFSVDQDNAQRSASLALQNPQTIVSSVPKADKEATVSTEVSSGSFSSPFTSRVSRVQTYRSSDESGDNEGGARRRTYADVAKSPVRSVNPVPPVSIKSDAQRNLERALEEWKQRLARLNSLLNGSASEEFSSHPSNEIVNQ